MNVSWVNDALELGINGILVGEYRGQLDNVWLVRVVISSFSLAEGGCLGVKCDR
jgi:hypothetical protein